MDFPLVSVIITAYNYAHFLATSIESALHQDYPNLEVVVMDNASTDETPALVKTYADADPRVRYIRHPENIGLTPNHVTGLHAARGEYVVFVSADDWLMPRFISRSYRFYQAHPDIDVLYTGTYFVDEAGHFSSVRHMDGETSAPYIGKRNEFAALLTEGCHICFPTMLIRRDLFERYGDLDTSIKAADYEIVIRWAAAGVRFAYDPEPGAVVRLHANQNSGQLRYGETGLIFTELLYLLERFVTPENERWLAGNERSIARNLLGIESHVQGLGYVTDAPMRERVERILGKLDTARVRNRLHRAPPFITIGVLARGPLSLIELTLRSLAAQNDDRFEVVVLSPPGHSIGPLTEYIGGDRRFRPIPLTTFLNDGATCNLAMRIGAGNAFTFVRSGNTFDPTHVARLCTAFLEHDADIVLSTARVIVEQLITQAKRSVLAERDDIYAFPALEALKISPSLPLESLAFTRGAADSIGFFNESTPSLSHWDYVLRLSIAGNVVAQSRPVQIRSYVGHADPLFQNAEVADIIRLIHQVYPEQPAIELQRANYLASLRRAIELGLGRENDVPGLFHQLAILAGTQRMIAPVPH